MISHLTELFPVLLVSLVSALLASPLVMKFCNAVGLIDLPDSAPHKQHTIPTPLAGGIVITLAIALTYVIIRPYADKTSLGILLGAGILLIWGIVDDRFGLKPFPKILGQVVVAGLLILFGVQVKMTRIEGLDLLITLIWIVGLINAFNFVDSMDGLAVGLSGIAAAFFMLVTIDSVQPSLAVLAATIVGASIGTFFMNAPPARMFLGDSGAQVLGFLLAAVGLAYIPAQAGLDQGLSWFIPILVMGVPIFDTTLVVVSRARRGQRVTQAGRDHTYHRLLLLGLDSTRAVLLMQLSGIGLGFIAFIALDTNVLIANAIFFSIILLGLISIGILERIYSASTEES